ncbi:aldo/keto reductase, partial [Acinetobacter baumannii]
MTDKAYDIIDELNKISKELHSSPSRVALAWLEQKAGVTSSILGARTLKQLDDNVAALDLQLNKEQVAKLDE